MCSTHCVKSVRIWSYSDRHFSAFRLNTMGYGVTQCNGVTPPIEIHHIANTR